MRLLPALLVIAALAGCSEKPVPVPVVVKRDIPPAPAECSTEHAPDLTPMPAAKAGDTVESYVAKTARVHRINRAIYRDIQSDRAVCRAYTHSLGAAR